MSPRVAALACSLSLAGSAFGQGVLQPLRPPAVQPAAGPGLGTALVAAEGEVAVSLPGGEGTAAPLALPFPLEPGSRVRTGKDGRATVQFRDLSRIRLSPGSVCDIDEDPAGGVALRLALGRLWASVVRRSRPNFRVLTSAAVAAVRGTEFSVEAPGERRTAVEVYSGVVAVQARSAGVAVGGEALLRAGERIEASDGRLGPVTKPEGKLLPGTLPGTGAVDAPEEASLKERLDAELALQSAQEAAQSAAASASANPLAQQGAAVVTAASGAAGSAAASATSAGGALAAPVPPPPSLALPDPGSLDLPDLPR